MPEVKVMVEAGKATAAAPLGPALGPLGVNIGAIVAEINSKTKAFEGIKIPVTIEIDSKKNFTIKVGSPPTSALIKKELNLPKGSPNPKEQIVGDISIEQVIKVAEMKIDSMKSSSLKSAAAEVMGSCYSLGLTVDGVKPDKAIKALKEGKYDSYFN
ncbi:MAG: 50S ribosomal protein L11 [Candidatus Diapherotrites archaeon]